MSAAGYTPEREGADRRARTSRHLSTAFRARRRSAMTSLHTADREEVMAGLTKAGHGEGRGLPPQMDPGGRS